MRIQALIQSIYYFFVSRLKIYDKLEQQRSLITDTHALDVTIVDAYIEYKNAKGYDANGCLDPTQPMQSKYFANLRYSIRNSGGADFVAGAGFVDFADCGTPSILGFLNLKIEGGIDGSTGTAYPAIELKRFAPCVIDDSDITGSIACVAGGIATNFAQKPSQSMGIQQGGSYGVSKTARARFPLSAEQFNAIKNSAPDTLTFTLSVNKYVAAYGAAGVVTAVDGSMLNDITWEASGQGTSKQLFIGTYTSTPPTSEPTVQLTAAPSAVPTDEPIALLTAAPSVVPTAPTTFPTTLSTITPSVKVTIAPTERPSIAPTAVPSAKPTVTPSAPTTVPTRKPTATPSITPTQPTCVPTRNPTISPTARPTATPTAVPTIKPTSAPSCSPTRYPTTTPTTIPTAPSCSPTTKPTTEPSARPTVIPSCGPTAKPTRVPTAPTVKPTATPTAPTFRSTVTPSVRLTANPTNAPTARPSAEPSNAPSDPSAVPTSMPTVSPSTIVCDNILEPNLNTTTVSGYQNDRGLAGVCLSTNIQSVSNNAFSDGLGTVASLSSIYIPSTVTRVGDNAFRGTKLKGVIFTGAIASIGASAFRDAGYDATTQIALNFPGDVGTIEEFAFQSFKVYSLSFGGTVGSIAKHAFGSNKLTSVTFPAGLSYLGDNAFRINPLTSVTFLGEVATIDPSAFAGHSLDLRIYYPSSWAIPKEPFPYKAVFVPLS